jgi:hypothetical protein
MKRYKLGFGNRPLLEQIAIGRRVADGIGRLPDEQRRILARHPVAASVAQAADACTQVESLKIALRAALARRDLMFRAMRDHTTAAADGIYAAIGGEPAALLAAGVGVTKTKQPVGRPDAPARFRILSTEFEGRVRLRWKRPVRRCVFIIQITTAPTATRGWKQVAICVRQTCDVKELKSGAKYWFRVAASNAHGQGPWSQPVNARVK